MSGPRRGRNEVPRSVGIEVTCPLCSGRGDLGYDSVPELETWQPGRRLWPVLPDWMVLDGTCPRCRGWGWVYRQGLSPEERADLGE